MCSAFCDFDIYDVVIFTKYCNETSNSISFDAYGVSFNQKGNVNQAKTIRFKNERTIIVELGGGRLAIQ